MRRIFCILLFSSIISQAQVVNDRAILHYDVQKEMYQKGSDSHTAFKPSFAPKLAEEFPLGIKLKDSTEIKFRPNLDLMYGYQDASTNDVYSYGYGGSINYQRNKWKLGINYLHFHGKYMDYQNVFIRVNKVVPGMNTASGNTKFESDYMDAHINYEASDIFNFEIGYGRNFIGDGYRSLLLSDAANASPYLKITTKFWKLQYTNLFAAHQNIFKVEGVNKLYQKKYTATHFLDWKANKWLTIGFFETIIWQAKEGNYTRGFDPTYANPIIFYRPVEFSVGSSDNALVGANLKFTVKDNHVFYSQIVLDEFLLSEIRADINQWRNPDQDIRSGWWGNKYGIQLGHTSFDPLGIKGLQTRLEFNLVRPYTYAHTSPTQAYANYNFSLAHPLGANFHEFVSIVQYKRDRWWARAQYNQSRKGYSFGSDNYGDNIQLSNTVGRVNEYENKIAQGMPVTVRYLDLSVTHILDIAWDTYLTAGLIRRENHFSTSSASATMIYFQLRTHLFNRYFDF